MTDIQPFEVATPQAALDDLDARLTLTRLPEKETPEDWSQGIPLAYMQEILDYYKTGINVVQVNMDEAQPPEEVQDAFEDAIKAREDEQRIINEANAYRNDVVPKARGDAESLLELAEAYKTRVIKAAQGETSRFDQLLAFARERDLFLRVGMVVAHGFGDVSEVAHALGRYDYGPRGRLANPDARQLRLPGR